MTKYTVTIYTQVWNSYEVEAETPQVALKKGEALDSNASFNEADGSEYSGYNVRDNETDQTWDDTDEVELDQMIERENA